MKLTLCAIVFTSSVLFALRPALAQGTPLDEIVVFGSSGTELSLSTNGPSYTDYLADDFAIGLRNYATPGASHPDSHLVQIDFYLGSHTPPPNTLFASTHWGSAAIFFGITKEEAAEGALRNIERLIHAGAKHILLKRSSLTSTLAPLLGIRPEAEQEALDIAWAQQKVADDLDALVAGTDITIHPFDEDALFLDMVTNPATYGFINTDRAFTDDCGWDESQWPECGDPDTYMWIDGAHWSTATHRHIANAIKLTLPFPMPGDMNADGSIDAADASVLFTNWGTVPPGESVADMNGDGMVDASDASRLASSWTGDPVSAVPEPDTTILCVLCGLGWLAKRRPSIADKPLAPAV